MTDPEPRILAALFDRALDLSAAERAALLDRECAGDAALRAAVEALLAADAGTAAAALEQLGPDFDGESVPGVELRPGDLVAGRYRVVDKIGEGGMGVVFEAEQLEPQRRVALKCLRAGLITPAARHRFRREAELLGRLRHPGIAQILEAGIVDGGAQPFFAMEFVDGVPLLDHAHDLPLAERLELFAQVCDAVQHAHALGIVHRDLKPANVLVDTGVTPPRPKVLDFGVGRTIAAADDGADTMLTGTHEIVGTLAFLSPEQVVRGSAAVGTKADVWSLGVTLYQMLSGRLPLDLAGRTLPDAARVLQDDEPTRIDRLVPAVRGDVATIVHKALAREPGRRYADAGELAADLRRYLRNEPIAARPTTTFYQLSRFARRHRALVFGLASTILALIAGLTVSLYFLAREREQRDVAERRSGDLRALTRDLIFDVEEQLVPVAGATAVRRKVVETGLHYAEGLLLDAGDDPTLLVEVGLAFGKLAAVLGDPSRPNLGDIPGATATLAKAITTLGRAADLAEDPTRALDGLLACRQMEAELHRSQNRGAERLAAMQAARDVAARLASHGDVEGAELAYAGAAANLGRLQFDHRQFADAIDNFEIYLDSQRRRIGTDDPVAARNAALVLGFVADARHELGDEAGSRTALDEALAIAETFHRDHPEDAGGVRSVVQVLRSLATAEARADRPAAALPFLERARALFAELPPDPSDITSQRERATVEFVLASALIDLDRADEAVSAIAAYQADAAALLAITPENRNRARDVMIGHQLAIRMHAARGDAPAALDSLTAALDRCAAAVAADETNAEAWEDLAVTQHVGARACIDLTAVASEEVRGPLRSRAVECLEAELATLGRMTELHFSQVWIAERQQKAAAMLADQPR